jgi:hypothetical protein
MSEVTKERGGVSKAEVELGEQQVDFVEPERHITVEIPHQQHMATVTEDLDLCGMDTEYN